MSSEECHISGIGILCFPSHSKWFQGYFVDSSTKRSMGLMGKEIEVDACLYCPHGGYREYEVTIIDYETNKEKRAVVSKTGGDYCTLSSETLTFETENMRTEQKAEESIRKYFPTILRNASTVEELRDCLVCKGKMTLAPFTESDSA